MLFLIGHYGTLGKMYPNVWVTEKEFSWLVAFSNMESLVLFLLLVFLPGLWSLAEIACRIAVKQNVQVTYLYRCTSCPSSFHGEHPALELELYQCVGSRLPMVTRNIEAHEVEPLRNTDSLSIFQIPAGGKGDSLVRRILEMLNPRQPRKHLHKYPRVLYTS